MIDPKPSKDLVEAISQIEEICDYFDERMDVDDGIPNEEMDLHGKAEQVLMMLRRLAGQAK